MLLQSLLAVEENSTTDNRYAVQELTAIDLSIMITVRDEISSLFAKSKFYDILNRRLFGKECFDVRRKITPRGSSDDWIHSQITKCNLSYNTRTGEALTKPNV